MNRIDEQLSKVIQPWIETQFSFPLSIMDINTVSILPTNTKTLVPPLRAIKIGNKAGMIAKPEWIQRLNVVVKNLHPDLLFSVFGTYELARITLPDGFGIWGPIYYMFADRKCLQPLEILDPVQLTPDNLESVDYNLFWHCSPNSLVGFGIFDRGRLVALASVCDAGDPFLEIGMDVHPSAKGHGLGQAVVTAAARWIVQNKKLVLATTSPFNVPSIRTLRSVGLRYQFSALTSTDQLMSLPPQPLGLPYPKASVYNFYPEWAMNKDIRSKPDLEAGNI